MIALLCGVLSGCSPANYDATTSLGKQAILDEVSEELSQQDCSGALAQIQPLYNSINTDNDVRMMTASAYGCAASINLFKLMGDLVQNAGVLAGSGFWAFLATEFPSTFNDTIAEAGQLGQDALHSVIDPGTVVLQSDEYNLTTFNPATYLVQLRLSSANAYLFFVTMSEIGSLENRYGNPDSSGDPGNPLQWSSATDFAPSVSGGSDGCAYASAVVNFVDSIGALAGLVPGELASTIDSLQTAFQTAIFDACVAGCEGTPIPLISGGGVVSSGCALSACDNCPETLRSRTSCTGLVTDPNSCAAAGIVNFINNSPVGGWQ